MVTITISIKEEINKEFRETVKKKLGQKKGVLGQALEEAMKKWMHDEKQREIAERQLELLEKGLYSLKGWKFNRDEIYDRES